MSTVSLLATDTGHLTDLAARVAHGLAHPSIRPVRFNEARRPSANPRDAVIDELPAP